MLIRFPFRPSNKLNFRKSFLISRIRHNSTNQKKGDSSNVTNYRPIAITSVLFKIMEKVINEQVLHHLESNNLIHDRQYGFRQFRSTGDILAHITHKWNKALETGKETFVVGLDISKAFDQV